jgi:hypothetical protein
MTVCVSTACRYPDSNKVRACPYPDFPDGHPLCRALRASKCADLLPTSVLRPPVPETSVPRLYAETLCLASLDVRQIGIA